MKYAILIALWCSCAAFAQQQDPVQRALIERDQQSAEFAAQLRGQDMRALENFHAQQLRDMTGAPNERTQMAQDRELRLPPPVVRTPTPQPPLPLPGGPAHIVDPVAAPSVGG